MSCQWRRIGQLLYGVDAGLVAPKNGDPEMTIQSQPTGDIEPVSNLPLHSAEQLTDGGNLAQIKLGQQLYTLRITRAGKLILTK